VACGLHDVLALAKLRFMETKKARAAQARACQSRTESRSGGGYKQGVIDWGKAMFGYLIEVVKRPELHVFKLLPKGWIIERTCGWFNCYRRLSKDYEHDPKTSEAIIHFVSCFLMLRRLSTL